MGENFFAPSYVLPFYSFIFPAFLFLNKRHTQPLTLLTHVIRPDAGLYLTDMRLMQ